MDSTTWVLYDTAAEVIWEIMETLQDDGSMTAHDLLTYIGEYLNADAIREEE